MSAASVRSQAHDFLVWREATAVSWKCTAIELARATRLHVDTVRNILKRRDWNLIDDDLIAEIRNSNGTANFSHPDTYQMMLT